MVYNNSCIENNKLNKLSRIQRMFILRTYLKFYQSKNSDMKSLKRRKNIFA